jgi:spore maturation protein CgeB
MLHERTGEVGTYFEEGKECAMFADADELVAHIAYYLDHDDERRRVSEAGHRRCLTSGYSYDDRAATVIAKVHALRADRGLL